MIRAGRNYNTPWTRDAAINTWQAMRFLNPEAARTTLLSVCTLNEAGEPIIQPDTQVWDQIVWAIGAHSYYLATGDEEFLSIAESIIGRALEAHRRNRFNAEYQLFTGGSFFNDGISGYPLECHKTGLDSSFAPDHPTVEAIMCLSTNCLYCEAYRIYAEIASHFGHEKEAAEARAYHRELKAAVNRFFLSTEPLRYRYILFSDGHTDDSQEASGYAFAILFDICPEEKQAELLEGLISSEYGTVSVYPPFDGLYSDSRPGRHSNVIWPFINGLIMQAAAKGSLHGLLGRELEQITALFRNSNYELFEIYSPLNGKAYGGWQLDRVWDSCRDQTWSATCYSGAFIHGIFAIRPCGDCATFSPCVPESLRNSVLYNLNLSGTELTVKINGWGTEIERFVLDGRESEPFVPYDGKAHKIEITMK